MNKHIKSANRLSGILIRSMLSDDVWLRVYGRDAEENLDYIDYYINHYDLGVTIEDPDAHIYKDEGGYYIDYSPETLGIKEVEDDSI